LPQYNPKDPPAWMVRVMNRIKAPEPKEEDFGDYWRRRDDEERQRQMRHEEVWGQRAKTDADSRNGKAYIGRK
jgi:hypothetical protein